MQGLGLKGLIATGSEHVDGVYKVNVEPSFTPTVCPKCGCQRLHKHGVRTQEYADVPHFGEPTVLVVSRRRWRCTAVDCGTLFPDPLPDMDDTRRATSRLIQFVGDRALKYTFSEVGRDVGLSDVSVSNIFSDKVRDLERRYEFVTPRVLGIDEVKIMGEYRCILTNIDKLTMYDLLPSRRMAALRDHFSRFKNPKDVEVFSTDLWNNYAAIAKDYFPHAMVVADRFHIQRMGSNGLESFRKAYRGSLSTKDRLRLKDERHVLLSYESRLSDSGKGVLNDLFIRHPKIQPAWECKERFFAIWTTKDRQEAGQRMDHWMATIPHDLKPHFKDAFSALITRREHILNYFDTQVTNAYTESINRLAKTINRMGRGYSLEVVRAKMLYDPRALAKGAMVERRESTKVVRDQGGSDEHTMSYMSMLPTTRTEKVVTKKTIYYGAHIPTLCDLLESGEFD